MSHFAEIDENGIVKRVLVVTQEFIDTGSLGDPQNWIQTSYNIGSGEYKKGDTANEKLALSQAGTTKDRDARARKNYAGVGHTYDKDRDAFIEPKPYDSWILDEDTCHYKAPIEEPKDGKKYFWDEETVNWKEK